MKEIFETIAEYPLVSIGIAWFVYAIVEEICDAIKHKKGN